MFVWLKKTFPTSPYYIKRDLPGGSNFFFQEKERMEIGQTEMK